ncbi:MAG TPA: hypothetical protein DCE42_07340 [Myxococcales bacterium]|nr:hypothetical protein [Deltaproteobacteria bacterium]MBU47289.1 hypothetical protein [Deltaproteobacteria bacterium]HAA54554.1 hypothetical protein [Myxococcales bacterium]|tara:strand:- start:22977 stop:25148 length:2172 start_codon:yes stop_codon:yes gene_type:complete
MRFYFPCAKGTQAIGHGEVFCGDSAAPALPKAFLIRNASMSWEHLLETHLVEEDWPTVRWHPHTLPSFQTSMMSRGGSSANLATLLAALWYHDPFMFQHWEPCHTIWASAELNPTTPHAYLLPVGEIEAKIQHFLEHSAEHGPGVFLASVGNYAEIESLRQQLGETFEEIRFRPGLTSFAPIEKPTIIWLGCSQEQWLSFLHWLRKDTPHPTREWSLPVPSIPLWIRSSGRVSVLSLVMLCCLVFGALASMANQYFSVHQALHHQRKALHVERRSRKQTEVLLHRVQRLVKQLSHNLKERQRSQPLQQRRLSQLRQRALFVERSLQKALRQRRHRRLRPWKTKKQRAHKAPALTRQTQAPSMLLPPSVPLPSQTDSPGPLDARALEKMLQLSHQTLRALRCTTLRNRARARDPKGQLPKAVAWRYVRTLRGPTKWNQSGEITHVRFSPDTKWLASANENRVIRVWSTRTGRLVWTLKGHKLAITDLTFSRDSHLLASTSRDRTIRLWSLKKGRLLSVYKGAKGGLFDAMFLPYSAQLLAVDNRSVYHWAASPHDRQSFPGRWKWASLALLSPDGRKVMTGGLRGRGHIWDTRQGRKIATLHGHTQRIKAAAWSSDGQNIATAGVDNTLRVWDVRSGKTLTSPLLHARSLRDISISPDGRVVLAVERKSLRLYNICSGRLYGLISLPEYNLTAATYASHQKRIAIGSADGELMIYRRIPLYRRK